MKILIIIISYFLLYSHVIVGLLNQWKNDENYSHGFLIPLISIFLVWKKWPKLKKIAGKPHNMGILIIILSLSLFIIGHIGGEIFLQRLSMVITIFGLILWHLGERIGKELTFPVFFLIFMIPLPYILYDSVAFPLQILASKISFMSLNIFGFPVFCEGNLIHLPSVVLQIEEACSGIRSLISLLALVTIYSYLNQRGFLPRLLLIMCAIPIAVISNSLRVLITGIIITFYGEKIGLGFFHGFSGWTIFLFAFILIYFLNKFISYSLRNF